MGIEPTFLQKARDDAFSRSIESIDIANDLATWQQGGHLPYFERCARRAGALPRPRANGARIGRSPVQGHHGSRHQPQVFSSSRPSSIATRTKTSNCPCSSRWTSRRARPAAQGRLAHRRAVEPAGDAGPDPRADRAISSTRCRANETSTGSRQGFDRDDEQIARDAVRLSVRGPPEADPLVGCGDGGRGKRHRRERGTRARPSCSSVLSISCGSGTSGSI